MPNCFQLIDKSSGKALKFNELDKVFCELLDQPVDPKYYVASWYDTLGLSFALGNSFEETREKIKKNIREDDSEARTAWFEAIFTILDWMEEHCTVSAWYSRR